MVRSGLLDRWDLGKLTLAETGASYEALAGAWLMALAGLAMIGIASILPRRHA